MSTQSQNTTEGMSLVTYKIESLEKKFDKFEIELKKAIRELSDSLDTKYVTKERAESLNVEVQAIRDEMQSIKKWVGVGVSTVLLAVLGAVLRLVIK